METTFLDLKFDYPTLTGASAYVVPRSVTTLDDGSEALTADCASIEEFEANVAIIHADLDKLVAEARTRFARADAAGPQPLGLVL